MTETQIQELLQNQTGDSGVGTGLGSGDILSSLFEPLLPMLTLFFIISIILTIIIVIFFIINVVQKQRQHAAIMRIDRNLQKIVDNQAPERSEPPIVAEQPATTNQQV
jgi:uncharacterized protein YacL